MRRTDGGLNRTIMQVTDSCAFIDKEICNSARCLFTLLTLLLLRVDWHPARK
jgi:hypothetical protein